MIIQTLEDLEKDLQKDFLCLVYLILGPEMYQCQQAVSLLKTHIVSPDSAGFDCSEFSAGADPVDQVIEAGNTFPMLSRRRLVLVADADKLQDSEQDALIEAFGGISPRSVLVFYAENFDHRKRFYREVRDRYCVAEFPKLKGYALERWAAAYVRRQGYSCAAEVIRKLVDLAGTDLQTVAAELDKLMLYAGKEKNIPDQAVDALVSASRQQGIFDFIDAVGERDKNAALRSLANLLSMGEHPLVIVTMLARHCRQILIAREHLARRTSPREIASAVQIPPFVLEKFLKQARAADTGTVQEMYLRLAEVDRKLKSSSADGRRLLEHLICALV